MLAKDLRMGTWIQQLGRIGARAGGSQVLQGGDDNDGDDDDGDDDDGDDDDGDDDDDVVMVLLDSNENQVVAKTTIMTMGT